MQDPTFSTFSYVANLAPELARLVPEWVLVAGIVVILACRLIGFSGSVATIAVVTIGLAFIETVVLWDTPHEAILLFGGLLRADDFGLLGRSLILMSGLVVAAGCTLTGVPDREDSTDFFTLLLGALLGMCLMASANHLLMVILAVEMASVPSYALTGFFKGQRAASEAALKYIVFGGAASGIMLYGLTLMGGLCGSFELTTISTTVLEHFRQPEVDRNFVISFLIALGLSFVGLGFKLSIVPFHFWCPDVFEGASAEVAGFLSLASKTAALCLAARMVATLLGAGLVRSDPAEWQIAGQRLADILSPNLALLAAITVTVGNLAALRQTNLKRLLAYSTIAHAGYLLMALVPLSSAGLRAALFYLIAYLFANLGAFLVVALIRNKTGSESIDALGGLAQRSPTLAMAMLLFLVSLAGLPPFVGFFAKYLVFYSLVEAGWNGLFVVGVVNTLIGAAYYSNLLRIMVLVAEPGGTQEEGTHLEPWPRQEGAWLAGALAAPILVLGLLPGLILPAATRAADAITWHRIPLPLGRVLVERDSKPSSNPIDGANMTNARIDGVKHAGTDDLRSGEDGG